MIASYAGPLHLLSLPFVQNALLAGTAVAACCGLAGYFVVLRAQVFAGDALSHVAYAGSLAALAAGADARLGLFVATLGMGAVFGLLGGRATQGVADDVVIGTAFAWILGLGVFFLALYTTSRSAGNGAANANVLFGSIFGISTGAALLAAAIALVVVAGLLGMARPLLFASLDAQVALARGVPVRLIGTGFLVLVGAAAAEATQVVGALLLVGLLATPAAAALRMTARPWLGMALSVAFGVLSVWAGIGLSYAVPKAPPSFTIVATATALYAGAAAVGLLRAHRRTGSGPSRVPAPAGATG